MEVAAPKVKLQSEYFVQNRGRTSSFLDARACPAQTFALFNARLPVDAADNIKNRTNMPGSSRAAAAAVAVAAVLGPLARAQQPRYTANVSVNTTRNYKFGAIYFGDWHVDPVMSALHGPGWTEWEVVTHATPRYEGHDQPNIPLEAPGFGKSCPEDVPANMEIKIQAAKAAGIDYFLFDWCAPLDCARHADGSSESHRCHTCPFSGCPCVLTPGRLRARAGWMGGWVGGMHARRYWYVQNTTRGAVPNASDNGNVFLGGALEDGFLKASNRDQMEFALMWANQDWVDVRTFARA